jgi:Protein of unknown function (DUF3800)
LHIVYLDESGTHQARYFVVAGLAVFEREAFHLANAVDQLQSRYFPNEREPVFFHASAIRAPDNRVPVPFNSLSVDDRRALNNGMYQIIANSGTRLFAAAMEKSFLTDPPYERGLEEIASRFDRMIRRISNERNEDQRGLVVIAESSYRENLVTFARRIWREGHRWGSLRSMADIPYFAPAQRTRMLQLADFVSNAVFARYENGINRDFEVIAPRFDQDRGRIHGLVHLAANRSSCYCPVCVEGRATYQPAMDQA